MHQTNTLAYCEIIYDRKSFIIKTLGLVFTNVIANSLPLAIVLGGALSCGQLIRTFYIVVEANAPRHKNSRNMMLRGLVNTSVFCCEMSFSKNN